MITMKQVRLSALALGSSVMITLSGCVTSSFLSGGTMTQFEVKLVDIGFSNNTALFSPDTLSISGDKLRFMVDITPKESFSGEPFRTIQIGTKNTGYQTLVQSTPIVWLVLLSRDGYFFGSEGPLTWTPEELRLPVPSERDYYKIQSMKEQREKQLRPYVSSSDKGAVALLKDSNQLMAELRRKQWKWMVSGDWLLGGDLPAEANGEYIRGRFEQLFNRYFKLVIVDTEGLQRLQYPDAKTKLIATWSGKGKFTTPKFTAKYNRIVTSWTGNPVGQLEYTLYSIDGRFIGRAGNIAEQNQKHGSGQPVQPGQSYYIEITTPQEMEWTFWLEETNLPP